MELSLDLVGTPDDDGPPDAPRAPHPESSDAPRPGPPPRPEHLVARCLLIANGGRLPAGITLLREARMDDGVLDVAAIDTVGGVVGWSSLARQVLPPFAASYSNPAHALGRVTLRRGTEAIVQLAEPAPVQIDGELLAPTRILRARLDAGALLVRRPG